jgi:uncharacterized membrane protein
LNEIIWVILLTLIPALELRASIPYGIIVGLPWPIVLITALITNFLLGIIIFFLIDKIIKVCIFIKPLEKIYNKVINRAQRKIHKVVEKYGIIGVAIFIGIPLPGSGVYTGALGSYLIGLDFKQFWKACLYGVLIAGILVTIIMLLGQGAWTHYFAKII